MPTNNKVVDAKTAAKIKRRLMDGERPYVVASDMGLPYMVVYKISTGQTWKSVRPTGGKVAPPGRITPGREMALSPEKRDMVYAEKRRTNATNGALAAHFGVSESSIARAVRDARALLAARVQRLNITSGNNDVAMEMYGLTSQEADQLLELASGQQLSPRLARELSEEN